jgi:hypothetical protein
MSTKKYTDWRSWWYGLRANLMKCFGTTGLAFLLSNGLSVTGIPGTSQIGINWRQAIGFFGVHMAFEIFAYFQKVQPAVITETTDTSFESKAPDGSTVTQSSSRVKITPIDGAKSGLTIPSADVDNGTSK